MGAIDSLQVWDRTTSFYNDELAPPSKSSGSLDRSIDAAVPVPVPGNKIHVRANHDTAIMYFGRTTRHIETFLNVNITRVREGLVVGNERVQLDNLLAMAQGLEVVGFNSTPRLFGRKCRDSRGNVLKQRTVWPVGLLRMRGMLRDVCGEA